MIIEKFYLLLSFFSMLPKGNGATNVQFWPFFTIPFPVNGILFRNGNEIEYSKTNALSMGCRCIFPPDGGISPLRNVAQFGHSLGEKLETAIHSQSPGGGATSPPCCAMHSSSFLLFVHILSLSM